MKIAVAVTGASGTIYAQRLIERLVADPSVERVGLVLTPSAYKVADYETGREWVEHVAQNPKVSLWADDDLFVPIASGSAGWEAMVVVPCSMGTLGRIAAGISSDLVGRAADVMLKERRSLILCPREAPLSLIHLRNMTAICEAGGLLLPAMPSFYGNPQSVTELVDTVVDRIAAHLGLATGRGWQE